MPAIISFPRVSFAVIERGTNHNNRLEKLAMTQIRHREPTGVPQRLRRIPSLNARYSFLLLALLGNVRCQFLGRHRRRSQHTAKVT